MKKHKKILFLICGLVALFVILLIGLQLLAPTLANLESTRVKIRQAVSGKTGGDLNYDRIGLSIFPRPGIVLEQATFSLPGALEGTVDSLTLQAKLLPLLKGKVVVSSLLVDEPSFSINISGKDKERQEKQEQQFVDQIKKYIQPVIAIRSIGSHDLDVSINDGTIALVDNAGPLLTFGGLDASLTTTAEVINVDIECSSDVSDRVAVTVALDPEKLTLQGKIDLEKAQLKQIFDRFYEPGSRYVKDTDLDLSFGFGADERSINVTNISGNTGQSNFTGLDATLDLSQEEPYVSVTSGSMKVNLNELREILFEIETVKDVMKDFRSVKGIAELNIAKLEGNLLVPEKWDFNAQGSIKNVTIDFASLPEQVALHDGTFEGTHGYITFKNVHAEMLDTNVTVAGRISNYMEGKRTLGLNVKGNTGLQTSRWIHEIAHIPPRFKIDHPLTINRARFDWNGGRFYSLNGRFSIPGDLMFDIDASYGPNEINIRRLEFRDRESNALIALIIKEKELRTKFSGTLTESTLSKFLVVDENINSRLKGEIEIIVHLDHPERFMANGHLEGENIIVPVKWKEELELKKISLKAAGDTVNVLSSEMMFGNHVLTTRGDIKGSKDGFIVNADVSSDGITWKDIERFIGKDDSEERNQVNEKKSSDGLPVKGAVKVHSDFFSYDSYRWKPVEATITFDRDKIDITVDNAVICNISTPGTVTITGKDIGLDFMIASKNKPFGDSLDCLAEKEVKVTGTFDLEGKISGRGTGDDILKSLKGNAELSVRDGVIYKQTFFTKVFAVINVTEIFRGNYADIETEGFAYSSMHVKADMHDGKIYLDEMMMDGSTLDMVGTGEMDLIKKRTDATFIVAPLKTVNAVVRIIPILRDITGGTLITVALKVTGKFGDPEVLVVPPSTVGEGLVGMMKRTFQLPFKILGLDDIGQNSTKEKEQSKDHKTPDRSVP
jgi:hypothetical protein